MRASYLHVRVLADGVDSALERGVKRRGARFFPWTPENPRRPVLGPCFVDARTGIFAALLSLALAGCGDAIIQQGPSDTLRAYARALEQGRVDDAYRLL